MLPRTFTSPLLLAVALVAPSLMADHHDNPQAQISSQMATIESNALDMREQAARLTTYNRTPQSHSWQLHADELRRISANLDRVGAIMDELKPMKAKMTFRQAAAYNKIVSLAVGAADATQEAIDIVGSEREKLRVAHPEYKKKVQSIYDHADQIAAHADNVEAWSDFLEDLKDSSDD
jgi:Mg2+ and Co2+ transporter CorA